MRNLAAALVLATLTAIGVVAPVAAAQTSTAKVVIIVGATHGTTSLYRSYADAAYAEAIKYTAKVTKVYSPNATWSKVKAATTGANVVIYFGHGNGWPSPYTFDPAYTTKDGFGLNYDVNGDGALSDYELKYYGEPSMADLGLAPNAIVLLHNLCYASGNPESGGAEPTVSVARQRLDNYAAGFLKGNAEAVLADGHMGPAAYLQALFTTSRTLLDVWQTAPNFHNHLSSFASVRSPGYSDYSDPDTTTGGYYRSLVTKPGLTTTAITKAVGDTGTDPASLVVPGRASVQAPPAGTTPPGPAAGLLDLPEGTRLKTVAIASPATTTSPAIIQVAGLDDPSIAGLVSAATLTPRDSRAPTLIGLDAGTARFSPNGDGRLEDQRITSSFSETVAWTLTFKNSAGTIVKEASGSGSTLDVVWDGLVNGTRVADGAYAWSVRGVDAWQNAPAAGNGSVVVDTVGATVTISPDGSTVGVFTPNGDGASDTILTSASVSEPGSLVVRVSDSTDATVKSWSSPALAGANAVTWDGKSTSGAYVADGTYTIQVNARDAAGNTGVGKSRDVRVIRFLSAVRTSATVFYPHDNDRFAATANLTFTLAKTATVTWTIRNAAGTIVATHLPGASVAAGTQTWVWNGRNEAGALLPLGMYTSFVTATSGGVSVSHAVKVELNAFAITTSTAALRRGSLVTVSVNSAEATTGSIRLYVTQPGYATWAVTMTRVDSRHLKSTIRLKTGGAAGKATIKVWGHDYDGRTQSSTRTLTLS